MNNIRSISIAISLFIHTSVIGLAGIEGWFQRWIPVIPPPMSTEVMLQFVDSPELAREAEEDVPSRLISDKTLASADMDEDVPAHPGKTRVEEVTEGKQIAKLSREMPRPAMPRPKPVEERPAEKQVDEQVDEQAEEQAKEAIETPRPIEPIEPQETIKRETPDLYSIEDAIQDASGKEIVSLPAISEDLLGAPEKSMVTFETQYHKLGPYFKQVKRKIEGYWLGYLVFKYPNTAPVESETTVSFKILATGEVIELDVVEHSGDIVFRDFCMATISNTAPYQPLPEGIDEVEEEGGLGIVFTFKYK